MVKAVIFDYFGVICSDEYWKFVKEDKNIDHAVFHDLADSVNLGEVSWQGFISKVAAKTGHTPDELANLYESQQIDPQLVTYIANLHGHYKTALLTNAHHQYLEPVIAAAKLDDIFDTIIISSRVEAIKPSMEIYQYTLEKLGVKPEEAVHIDDIYRHVEGARAAGMQAIYYENFPQMKRELEAILAKN